MPALKYWNGSAWATISSVAGPAGPPGADSTVPGPIGPSSSVHEEFKPANLATTVTLSQVPIAILVVARDGVVQSATDGNYTLAGSVLTFTDAFNGTERLVVDYSSTSYTPALPINGTTGISDQTVTNVKLASDTARANLLTNGGFEVWQRGNGPFTAASGYTADRWLTVHGAGASSSLSRDVGENNTGYSAKIIYTAGSAATAFMQIHRLSGENAELRGRTFSFSARVYSTVANAVRLSLNSGTPVLGAYHPGDSTWRTLTVTAAVPAAATEFQATFEFAATGTFYMDAAMLVVGSVPADYAPLHPADDLVRCERYYERFDVVTGTTGIVTGQVVAAGLALFALPFKATKAVTPTVTFSPLAQWALTNAGGGAIGPANGMGTYGMSPTVFWGWAGVASGLVAGNATILMSNTGQTATMSFEANP